MPLESIAQSMQPLLQNFDGNLRQFRHCQSFHFDLIQTEVVVFAILLLLQRVLCRRLKVTFISRLLCVNLRFVSQLRSLELDSLYLWLELGIGGA